MVEELIKRTKRRMTLEEAYKLDKEIVDFLNDESVPTSEKIKLRAEGLLEPVSIASDGYKKKHKLEHYSESTK